MKRHLAVSLTLALAASVQAAPIIATDSQTNGTNSLPHTYVVSASDLLNGLLPSSMTGNFGLEGADASAAVLTNGAFPSPITRDGGGPFQFSAFSTGGNGGGTSLTYNLGGQFNLTSFAIYGGWQDGGRDQQGYTILYSTEAVPLTFVPLTTVNFNPPDPAGNPQVTRVTITDTTGTLAAAATAVRINFNNVENGYTGYSEIDLIGTAVPEPTSALLLSSGLAFLGMVRRRRA